MDIQQPALLVSVLEIRSFMEKSSSSAQTVGVIQSTRIKGRNGKVLDNDIATLKFSSPTLLNSKK